MLSEVINALYVTYIATEYHSKSDVSFSKSTQRQRQRQRRLHNGDPQQAQAQTQPQESTTTTGSTYYYWDNIPGDADRRKRVLMVTIIVVIWNIIDSMSGFGNIVHEMLDMMLLYHIPRILFVISSYIIALYYDCYVTLVRQLQQLHSNNAQPIDKELLTTSSVLPWKNFLPRILRYFLRIVPIYPIMAVLISFLFLFVISLFEMVGLSTDILNLPIYYGTLYGPFSYIYYHVKHDIVSEQATQTTSVHSVYDFHPTTTSTTNIRINTTLC
jgi:hypothetical protein